MRISATVSLTSSSIYSSGGTQHINICQSPSLAALVEVTTTLLSKSSSKAKNTTVDKTVAKSWAAFFPYFNSKGISNAPAIRARLIGV